MDDEARAWSDAQLVGYLDHYHDWFNAPPGLKPKAATQVASRLPLVLEIAERVRPGLSRSRAMHTEESERYRIVRDIAAEALAYLRAEEELAQHLGPKGPVLAARGLHPWVWEPAARLWSEGNRREAIQAAATQVELHLQAKLGRPDQQGSNLAMQGFDPSDPTDEWPRLRLPDGHPGGLTWKSKHEGAKFYGAGVFLAVRNVATHTLDQPDEDEALERLAALSLLARLTDEAEVVRRGDG